ncbi:MAG: hypothetical protein ACRCXB_29160 [Aeromonadaceae bacterium]
MSNEADLDWLARNVNVWRDGANYVCVNHTDGGYVFHEHNRNCAIWFTKSEWLARRAELQNKPSWKDAPEWAQWMAQDEDGEWWFFSGKPKAQSVSFGDQGYGISADYAKKGETLGDWRDTLEERPADMSEQAVTVRLKDATGSVLAAIPELMTDKYKFVPFVSVEDAATAKQPAITPSKYTKTIHGVSVDVYDVLQAWGVSNPALQHLIKKALQCGQRGHKDNAQDLQDIIDSAIRAKELG